MKEKELKNTKKNVLSLPKIKPKNMSKTSMNKDFNSADNFGESKIELTNANLKDENNINNTTNYNNNFKRTNYSQEFHKELSTEQNLNNKNNESKNVSVIGENEESMNLTYKKDIIKRHTLINNLKDPEELKALLDKEISGKSNHAYHRMKTENMFKNLSNCKSSNKLLNQITHGSEGEESNKSHYDRFFKMKQKLQTHAENYDEENKIPEIEQKEDEEAEGNLFDFGLKKPKRKIQIAIFTQKNINDEEIHDLEPFMKRLEINEENEQNKSLENESADKKAKGNDKDKKAKYSPLKHPLVFPELNKYGLYSGYKKQEMKVKYGKTVLKKNSGFNKNRNSFFNNSACGSQDDIKVNNSTSNSPQKKNENKDRSGKTEKLPKVKGKLQTVYKDDPELINKIKSLKHINNLSLEEYQLKLIEVAKKILDDENLKNLVNRFKDISDISQTKDKVKYHRSINRWEIMVKVISRYIPEFLVEKLKSQK